MRRTQKDRWMPIDETAFLPTQTMRRGRRPTQETAQPLWRQAEKVGSSANSCRYFDITSPYLIGCCFVVEVSRALRVIASSRTSAFRSVWHARCGCQAKARTFLHQQRREKGACESRKSEREPSCSTASITCDSTLPDVARCHRCSIELLLHGI